MCNDDVFFAFFLCCYSVCFCCYVRCLSVILCVYLARSFLFFLGVAVYFFSKAKDVRWCEVLSGFEKSTVPDRLAPLSSSSVASACQKEDTPTSACLLLHFLKARGQGVKR